jgi:hypothetical protein
MKHTWIIEQWNNLVFFPPLLAIEFCIFSSKEFLPNLISRPIFVGFDAPPTADSG